MAAVCRPYVRHALKRLSRPHYAEKQAELQKASLSRKKNISIEVNSCYFLNKWFHLKPFVNNTYAYFYTIIPLWREDIPHYVEIAKPFYDASVFECISINHAAPV